MQMAKQQGRGEGEVQQQTPGQEGRGHRRAFFKKGTHFGRNV